MKRLEVDGGGPERKMVPRHNPESPRRPNSMFALVSRARLEWDLD